MTELIAGAVISIISFTIGAIVGQKVEKKEPIIQLPKIESFEERRERNLEIERNSIMMRNIDNYNGTGLGQEHLPE